MTIKEGLTMKRNIRLIKPNRKFSEIMRGKVVTLDIKQSAS